MIVNKSCVKRLKLSAQLAAVTIQRIPYPHIPILLLMAAPLRPYPPPPSGAIELFFSNKIAGNGFCQFFSAPHFWTKIALFLENIVTIIGNNPDKIPTDRL